MAWLLLLGGLAALAAGLRMTWPRLRIWLIRGETAPAALREFAAGTLVQGGIGRTAAYAALIPWVHTRLPRWLIARIARTVARQHGENVGELERPLEDFATLDELFTRAVNPALRPICREGAAVVSPVDAEVVCLGVVDAGTLIQAKGMPYRLADLLPIPEAEAFEGGCYVVLYLRATDCHRVFCPADDVRVRASVAVPGRTMPVAPAIGSTVPNLYTQNKRVAHLLDTPEGPVALVMVGAYLVGEMDSVYDPQPWPRGSREAVRRDYAAPQPQLGRGEWMATFHLGSTVVLLFAPGRFQPAEGLLGRRVRYGERVGSWTDCTRSERRPTVDSRQA